MVKVLDIYGNKSTEFLRLMSLKLRASLGNIFKEFDKATGGTETFLGRLNFILNSF